MKKGKKILTVAAHITLWIIFIFFPLVIFPETLETILSDTFHRWGFIYSSIVGILFFYFNYSIAIPKVFYAQNKWIYFLLLICVIILLFFSHQYITHLHNISANHFIAGPPPHRGFMVRILILLIVSWGIRLFQKTQEYEEAKKLAELSYLKAQINPHFLFNTLNGIYGLALTQSSKTAESIQQLSSIMKYAIVEATAHKVSLEKEINNIRNYIALQQLRLTEKTKVLFTASGDFEQNTIEPLILITFIENAFKFGVSTEHETEISIHIDCHDDILNLIVKNQKINIPLPSYQTGLKNATKRLTLAYPKKHRIEIENEDKWFSVNLYLDLK